MTDASDGGHPERLTTDVQEAAAALLALASGPPRPSIVPPKPGTGLAKPGITPPVLFTHKTGSLHKRRASVPPNKVRQKRLGTSLFDLSPVRLANRTKRARIEDEEDVPAETTAARVLYNKNNNKRVKPTLQQPTKATRKAPSARPGIKSFNIFEAFLSHTDLLILVVGHLASPDLLNLYAMSAPFHYAMNSNWMTFILASTKRHAPNADKIFPWYCFRRLNMSDPAARISRVLDRSNRTSLLPQDQKAGGVKIKQEEELERAAEELNVRKAVAEVPGFRWLKMVTYREAVVREIVGYMAYYGHKLPVLESIEAIKASILLFPSKTPPTHFLRSQPHSPILTPADHVRRKSGSSSTSPSRPSASPSSTTPHT